MIWRYSPKVRGTREPFRVTPLEKLMDVQLLPDYDHTRKWTAKPDRPPRKTRIYNRNNRTSSPSNRQECSERLAEKHSLSRQNSELKDNKKTRKNDDTEGQMEEDTNVIENEDISDNSI